MKYLLRSVICCEHNDDKKLFFENYLALSGSGLGFDVEADGSLWEVISDFVATYGHVPELKTLRDKLKRAREDDVINRLEMLITFAPITQGDFVQRMEMRLEQRNENRLKEILNEAANVMMHGLEVKEGRETKTLRGFYDAYYYIVNQGHDLITPALGQQLSGVANKDSEGFTDHYEKKKRECENLGYPTGIEQIDTVLRGAKRGQLWLHSAYTGHMKSTFMVNWAYTQAIYYKTSSLIFSLEMPYVQIRDWIYALHTFHPKFRDVRVKLGIQEPPKGSGDEKFHDLSDNGLIYTKIRDAELNDDEEDFLFNYVIPDYEDNNNNYGNINVEVANPDKDEFTIIDLRLKAELLYSKSPFSILYIDHLGLMSARRWVASTTERLNEVLRDSKRLAMTFNRGLGIAVVGLFQLSREGVKAAEKNGGKYNLTHLSYANEAERSADIVTAGYIDEKLRKNRTLFMQNLKSRDQAPFENFYVGFVPCCRRMLSCDISVEEITKTWTQEEKKSKSSKFMSKDMGSLLDSLNNI